MASNRPLYTFRPTQEPHQARLTIDTQARSPHKISPYLTGKFCEHLWSNICHGMHAQILHNPTFAEWVFAGAGNRPDGGVKFQCDEVRIAEAIRFRAKRAGWPDAEVERLAESRPQALAHWWIRRGDSHAVRTSPDVGPHGGRAQRVEVLSGDAGIEQLTYLPLHRVRKYDWRVVLRSPDPSRLTLRLESLDGKHSVTADIDGVCDDWNSFEGELSVGDDAPADGMWRVSITADRPGQFVIARALLYPSDHLNGADPDTVRYLRESRLPVLRWPGGNFASTYHWEDGVGPVDERPTHPNLAWGNAEPNLFGTAEFVAFCRAVGCEPMICVNAGSGSPEEAARWVEYCNGTGDSAQARRRAEHGYAEPFNVRYWEIGNEIAGRWQMGWTTRAGYADRYRRFAEAILAVDPSVELIANGQHPLCVVGDDEWDSTLFEAEPSLVRCITDHLLVGGTIDDACDPLEVYQDFMAVPFANERTYRDLQGAMTAAGIAEPRVAITELQLFGRLPQSYHGPPRPGATLTHDTLVDPTTMAEAIWDVLFYHSAVRLVPFVEMITHTGTVNHGGGLRKEKERVYCNPCHHAQSMFAAFANAVPVSVKLEAAIETRPKVVEQLTGLHSDADQIPVVDAVAALSPDGELLVSLVNLGTGGPVAVSVRIEGYAASSAEVRTLAADVPWAANTLDQPNEIAPTVSQIAVTDGVLGIELAPYSVVLLRVA